MSVDCVWVSWDGSNTHVEYARATDGAQTYGSFSFTTLGPNSGDMSLRSVAIDMYVTSTLYKCTVVWTNGNDVYYKFRTQQGTPMSWGPFTSRINGATTSRIENFVDVAVDLNYNTATLCSHVTWQVDNTAVFYGKESA